jgi:hypothetical protein
MNTGMNLKKAERRALSMRYKDGLLEINLGLFLALIAMVDTFEAGGLSRFQSYLPAIIVFAVGLLTYYLVKPRVVDARLGLIKVSPRSNAPHRWLLIIAVALQLVTLLIYILASSGSLASAMQDAPNWIVDAGFGLAIFGFFALWGYYVEAPRFYLYGLLLGAAMPAQQALWPDSQELIYNLNLIAGLVMLAAGSVVFVRFLRRYPVVTGEAANG